MTTIERVQVAAPGLPDLLFDTRVGMSDYKAIREVVERRGYARHGFTPSPGERWLDLGANVGAFTVWAAMHGADVIAFEPEPGCLGMAARNVRLNAVEHRVHLVGAAVWPDDSRTEMSMSVNGAQGNVWRSSLLKRWRGGTDILVPVVDVRPFWLPGTCVKMDIEGAEMPILEALAESPVKRLVFEWSFDIDRDLARFRDVVARLEKTYAHVRGVPWGRVGPGKSPDDRWQMLGPANAATIYCWND
jgi:FkbM family methyltransferase